MRRLAHQVRVNGRVVAEGEVAEEPRGLLLDFGGVGDHQVQAPAPKSRPAKVRPQMAPSRLVPAPEDAPGGPKLQPASASPPPVPR